MAVTQTMKWMGRSARNKAEAMSHSVRDRALEKRLERTTDEADRLRLENDLLRDEVSQARTEHGRILDLLESRMNEPEPRQEDGKRSHRGRWLVVLMAIGGGAYAWMMRRRGADGDGEWAGEAAPTRTDVTTM